MLPQLPVLQLSAFKPAAHVHHPSVCRHFSYVQLGEHFHEQFLPNIPSLQAAGKKREIGYK